MATGRVLKNLFLGMTLAGTLLAVAPVQAGERHLGQQHEYRYHRDYSDHHRHRKQHYREHRRWDRGHHYRHGWHHRPHSYYHAPRRHWSHRHYRGCGHHGYGHGGLVGFVVEYSRYDD